MWVRTVKKSNILNSRSVAALKEPGRYADGLNLYLQIAPGGSRSWLFRYTINGRAREMGLGPLHTIGLAEARGLALQCRRDLLEGIDPLAKRDQSRAVSRQMPTFEECADAYITANEAAWKNEKHREQWRSTLKMYAFPKIGSVPIDQIDVACVLSVIEPLWHSKTETAHRIRGRIEKVLDWAGARGYRTGANSARWKGHLANLLPSRGKVAKPKHHAAMAYADMPEFMARLILADGVSARALELLILTASRTNEVIGARWTEFDLTAGLWIVPADRMKAGREHRVPLAPQAMAILKALRTTGEFVFEGSKPGKPLSNMALLAVLRRMGCGHVTAHGFRSTFKDWTAEKTDYANEVSEMALAHAVGDKTEAAYRRGDLFDKRRALANDWADYCLPRPAILKVAA